MNKVKNIAIWITAVAAAVSSLYGGYSFFTRKIIETDRVRQHEIIIENKFNKWILLDSIKNIQMDKIIDTLNLVVKNQFSSIKAVNKLNNGFTKHLKQTDRIEELLYWYEY